MSAYLDTAFALRWILVTIALAVGFGLGYEGQIRKARARQKRRASWDAYVLAALVLAAEDPAEAEAELQFALWEQEMSS